jgi:hypothetical protein
MIDDDEDWCILFFIRKVSIVGFSLMKSSGMYRKKKSGVVQ